MKYLDRSPEKRENLQHVLPHAKSVISCALNYNTDCSYSVDEKDKSKGWISRYAWGDDYHEIIEDKLRILMNHIKEEAPEEVSSKLYVDTGPVLEKVYGKYGGLLRARHIHTLRERNLNKERETHTHTLRETHTH